MSYLGKSFLAVIPAREHSRRLLNKNTQVLCGKPLIHWVIKAAKESVVFDEIVLMSDSKNAREYAISQGISVYKEPEDLATDTAYVGDALIEMLNSGLLTKRDYVQLIEPTAPLVRPAMIQNAVADLIKKDADFIISMCEAEAPSGVAKPILAEDYCVTDWWPEELFAKRSQDCELAYRVDGLIYVGRWDIWLQRNYWKSKIYAFITDRNDSVDINTITDLHRAEAVLTARLKKCWTWW